MNNVHLMGKIHSNLITVSKDNENVLFGFTLKVLKENKENEFYFLNIKVWNKTIKDLSIFKIGKMCLLEGLLISFKTKNNLYYINEVLAKKITII